MNTAERLYFSCPPESLESAAENNKVSAHRFGTFTRYIFRDDSMLVIESTGKVYVYESTDEGS